jgi:selenocysteine-specific elongation factor
LTGADGRIDPAAEVRRRELVSATLLRQLGVDPAAVSAVRSGDWLLSHDRASVLRDRAIALIRDIAEAPELGMPVPAIAQRLDVPAELVRELVQPPLQLAAGVLSVAAEGADATMAALDRLLADLGADPFVAPTADRLRELGLDSKTLSAAVRAGRLFRLPGSVVLLPGADRAAVRLLAELPQPFTIGHARECLGASRRVVVPLLEHLERVGATRRLSDGRHQVVGQSVAHHGHAPANH